MFTFDTPITEVTFSEQSAREDFLPEDRHLVFVYGTLLPGQPNHPVLTNDLSTREVGEAVLRSNLGMVDLGAFPGLVIDDEGWHATRGQVFEVSTKTLGRLDRLEQHPNFYRRAIIGGLNGVPVWTYVLLEWDLVPDVGEDWVSYREAAREKVKKV